MFASYIQKGEIIDYYNDSDTAIPAFTILGFGGGIGIVSGDIAAYEIGALCLTGVFEFTKNAASDVYAVGAPVYCDPSTGKIYTAYSAGYILAGYAVLASAATDTYVTVVLTQRDASSYPTLSGSSDPTTATVGAVGQLYNQTADDSMFVCVKIDDDEYTWKEITNDSLLVVLSGESDPTEATAGAVGQLYHQTTDDGIFMCVKVDGTTYTWKEITFVSAG